MNQGALFYRADLHIHSYGLGGSFDVKDTTNTPNAIVDTAIAKGLKVISITDHNEFMNSISAVEYAKDKDILVVPGIEVSTTQGHLLLYFETIEQLRSCCGRFTFNTNRSICNQGIVECLRTAENLHGIGILAHINLDSGFEKTIRRFGPQMEEIFRCKNLYGLEITSKDEIDLYTDDDCSENKDYHKNLLKIWRDTSENKLHRDFAKLMSSDSHTLEGLGRNAEGNLKLTRIKMANLKYRAFQMALMSSESRVRIEDFIPDGRPYIKHIKIDGELLDGVDIDLSPNLTCIIGSRGTGKSTFLESIRESSGNHNENTHVCDSEVWPQSIYLDYVDEAGRTTSLQRDKNANITNRLDPDHGIRTIPIDSYGQGETADTIQHSEENPKVIVDFLDGFLDLELLKTEDLELVEELIQNRSELSKIRINLASLPEAKRALENVKRKIQAMEKTRVAEIVKFNNALLTERELRKDLIDELNYLVKSYRNILGNNDIFNKVSSMSSEAIVVGKEYFEKVKQIVNSFAKVVSSKSDELSQTLNEKISQLQFQLKQWRDKEKEIQDKIELKKQELTQQGIPFNLGQINQCSKDLIEFDKKVKKLEEDEKNLSKLLSSRTELINKRKENKKEIYRLHYNFASKINSSLKNSVDDFFINIKYKKDLFAPEFVENLKTLMNWRTSQVNKATVISKKISLYDFVDAVKRKDKTTLASIKNDTGDQLLSKEDIEKMLAVLNDGCLYEELESSNYDDLPSINITKNIQAIGGKKVVTKRLSQLSLGQQQSVLLGILLLSDSNRPLLIDQPEDNLDSEFIFKTIVYNLRKIKELRQIIIVTHNPNIAVLGDAELIIPLKNTNAHTTIISSGSIDEQETVSLCCQILEGGNSAFKQRKVIYGF